MMPALLNHLWQSTLFGGAVALLALALRESSAGLRFWLWLAASVKFLVPFALLSAAGTLLAPAFDAGPGLKLVGEAAQSFPQLLPGGPVIRTDLTPVFDPAPWLLGVWAAGAAAILTVRAVRWRSLQAILRTSRPLPFAGPIPVRVSMSVLEPGLFGVLRPAVLLPQSLPQTLRPDEIEAILAHETAHHHRRDNLWAAVHMGVEVLVWFHPMVWWIGRRMIDERERACDAAVVQRGHRREVYARAILESCRVYLRSPLACVSGASGSGLADRIETIMTAEPAGPVAARHKAILLTLSMLVLTVPLLTGLAAPAGGSAWPSDLFASGPTRAQMAHDLAEQSRPRKAAPFDPARFDIYAGDYQDGPYAIMSVTRSGDRFFTQIQGQGAAELYPQNGATFFYKVVSAQVSFEAGALVLHQSGLNRRLPKLDPATAAQMRASLARRIADNRPSPGMEDYVRGWLASDAAGRPDYSRMDRTLAQAAKQAWPQTRAAFATLGPLKGLRFLRVSPQGADLYQADFRNGRLFIRVEPLVRGKAVSHFWRLM
jgi:beta-lactamase regulating signal transducer with metallopeptidase domain